ncbi:CHAT domain-containing protein [Pseudanabaena sp. FACHB-1998]|uniref:CHAT domain-containing protein n=1 Tax=Pseudanabaena sp. FACHB-1998 TaxID=2692858 RepID=UPI00167FFF2B|nr:CHAT domain-containing protein [Pseudanabaena sp. FACHB-1998]MBD2177938.1 CHAT domain-containing protein [Pseudanabaena sp. FACHB-1998]
MAGLLLKARRFGVFSIVALTSTLVMPSLATQAQITTDGSTATEVKGNVIAPTGQGTANGGNLYNSFDKFNVPNSGVIFNTGTSSVDGAKVNNIINRVTGDTPSNILGTIESRQAFPNANLYLLNPNGIVFGVNSRLDIGGSFYANTGTSLSFDQNQKFNVDKNSLSFPSGDPKSIQFAVAQPAAIINQGNLSVDAGKNISLTAGTIINTGNLSAPAGNVNVAAVAGNSQVELRSPDLVLGLAVTKNAVPTTWNGTISALPKLAELLTGKAAQANQVVVKPDGSIALVASPAVSDIVVKDGMAIASGTINVSSNISKGGNVGIFGDQVGLVNAQINASGVTGGGTVLIGGNLQGKGIAPNALQTYIDASSNIFANGLLTGDGGKVIIWSDRSTQFYGAIAARGGDLSGNGGFVEVSGKENLDYRGNTDTRALNGTTGTLLLDPTNITVAFSGSATLNDASAFTNTPGSVTISSSLIDSATSNVVLQATNDISFSNPINIGNLAIGITAQAGNSITVNSAITTNGGNVRLIANDPAFATGAGNISINAPITTNGGAIDVQIIGAGQLSVNGNLTSSTGNINLIGNSTSANGISLAGFNNQISSSSGTITINGTTSATNGNGLFVSGTGSVAITSTNGTINLSGNSIGALGGNGILFSQVFTGNSTTVQTNGNINFTGNVANPVSLGINIQSPAGGNLTISSGSGNLTFTSDKSSFPNTGIVGTGNITLQAFSNNAALVIDGSTINVSGNATNVFLDSSFTGLLGSTNTFNQVIIGNSSSNNAIALNNNLFIGTPNFAPISIRTGNTFNGGGFAINTSQSAFNLVANQGINNLGDLLTDGKDITISSSLGNIISSANTVISSFSTDIGGGNISITANNGLLNLQGLDSGTTSAFPNNAGNITLVSAGQISFGNIRANRGNASGNAGTLSVTAGANSNIVITGNTVNLSAFNGSSSNLTFSRPVVIDNSAAGSSLTIDTTGTTNGSVTFANTITSPVTSALSINTNSGNVTFSNAIASNGQSLGDLTIASTGTTSFASTVFANSITSNLGNTIINADLVATGANGITLRNFTVNGNVSLVGDELDFNGIASGTGNLTLKPVTVSQPIAIGGAINTNGILDLTTTDLVAFAGGTFSSLTIGNLLGTGAITFIGNTSFAQPTIVRSPLGAGNVTINNNITATGSLTVESGTTISIANNAQITSSGGALNVVLNSDRDANTNITNRGNISIASGSLINSSGGDIVLGSGANPLTIPTIFAPFANFNITVNGTIDAAGGNITLNGGNFSNLSGNNIGVQISNGGQILTNGTGNVVITGFSGTGISDNKGIEIFGSGSIIQASNGNITLTGATGGNSSNTDGIRITNSAIIQTTGTGNLNLSGRSTDTNSRGRGILVIGATLAAIGTGNITLTGTGGTGSLDNFGISLGSTAGVTGQIITTSGSISLTGDSRSTFFNNNKGVLLDGNITVRANGNGNIAITGLGGNGNSNNHGVEIRNTGTVVEAANGNITITGTGNGTTSANNGILITNDALIRTTGSGNLDLSGNSNSNGNTSSGIVISRAILDAIGTGNITLTGNSGTGAASVGVSISSNSTLNSSLIRTADGSITIIGTSNAATGDNNQGVLLGGNVTIFAANNNANLTITGTGGLGTNNNQGIRVDLGTSTIRLGSLGNLLLTGTGRGTGIGNHGIFVSSGNVDALGTGSVTFTGFAPVNSFGILLSNANIKPTNTSGLLRFSADEIDSNGLSNISGTGLLFIEPVTATRNIVIGGIANANDGNLEVSNALVNDLQNGFSQIFIGRTDSSGLISLAGNATFASSLTLRSPLSTGAINTSGFNFRNITGDVTFLANQNITAGNIIASGNATSLTSTSGAIDTSSGTIDTSADGNGGNIIFSSVTGLTVGSLNTASKITGNAGAIAFGNGNITINGSSINVSSVNGTVPNLNFAFPVILNSPNLTITATTGGANGGVSFANTLSGTTAGVNNLTIDAGTGNLTFSGAVGSNAVPLGNLIANSTGLTRFSNTVSAASLTTNAGGSTEVNGNITTLGNQTFNDNVIVGTGITDITFDADSNSDSVGTFSNLGTVNGTGKNISIRAASLNIGGDITADKLTLIPSIPNPTIAIGSSASGNFVISDTAIPFLKANLVAIAVNNNDVNIGTNQAFANGTSLEIGTAASPASSIIAVPNFTLNFNVNGNLSLAASNIQLGNTNVGGDLTFTNPLTLGQSTGSLTVNGTTKFLINNPDTDIILRRGNLLKGGVSFAGSQSLTMRDLDLNNIAENSSITNLPTNFRDLVLTLENSTINLSQTSLTGKLELTGRDVIIDQDVVATAASLRGGNITIARNFTTTDSSFLGFSLDIDSSGTFRISPTSKINVAGEFFDSGTGNNAIAGNITANSVFFNRPVNLVGDTTIVSSNSMRFFRNINGGFALNLDANGNQISLSQVGDITPLSSFAIAPSTTLTPYSSFSESSFDKDNININVTGNISLGNVINDRDSSITLSSQGAINIGNINTAPTTGNAGNVTITALQNLTTGNINASAIAALGGNVRLTSSNGSISTGDVNTSGSTGGEIFYNASTAINAGRLNASGRDKAGNVTLDPSGDVVVSSIDASSLTQGGNVTLVSTGGNLKITDTILSSITSSCIGSSICTVGGLGGSISLQTGGLNSFVVGDATVNGSRGILNAGLSTLNLGTTIPVLLGSTFTEGGISISPGGFAPIITIRIPSDPTFEPPKVPEKVLVTDPIEEKLLGIRDIAKKEADRYLTEGRLDKAFDAIERAYASELEIFTGNAVGNSGITIEKTQDLLSTVAQQTGDVAALIYPVLLNNRIEILVIPPKEKGVPFRRFTLAANQEIVETVVNDYRNNLRDVGSNDYLEQSQKLYDWIIRPIDKELKAMKVNTLVFVMDGGLRVSPPASLHDGKQFLIERYAIANIPSMRVTRVEERDRKATRVLAMGLTESVEGFSALPSVDIEIKTISAEVLKGAFFLNKEFTVNNLQNQRQQGIYNILHLGTHAKFVSDTNKDSFIQFWDSRLQLSQIPKLRFDSPVIDMLTLSACQTAVGNNLGISGLAVESGARSVLASLWEVSDTGTAPLMISFYNAFPDAVNKAQAMQTAQINLLLGKVNVRNSQITGIQGFPNIPLPSGSSDIDLSHPFYWSSFILVGNWL